MSTETITSWMERINELIKGYSLENVWNMDESGCFFKALTGKRKENEQRVGKELKQRLTVAFFC